MMTVFDPDELPVSPEPVPPRRRWAWAVLAGTILVGMGFAGLCVRVFRYAAWGE